MPRLRTEQFGSGDQTWRASTHGKENQGSAVLDVSTFTKATHYPDGYFRAGTPVNRANAAALKPWTDTAGEVLGFVAENTATDGVTDQNCPVLRHGQINTDKVPVLPFTHATGNTAGFVFVVKGA